MQWFTMKETAAVALVNNRMNVAAAVALCASARHSRPDLLSQQEDLLNYSQLSSFCGDSVWTTGVDVK